MATQPPARAQSVRMCGGKALDDFRAIGFSADSSFAPRPRAHRRQADSDRAAVSHLSSLGLPSVQSSPRLHAVGFATEGHLIGPFAKGSGRRTAAGSVQSVASLGGSARAIRPVRLVRYSPMSTLGMTKVGEGGIVFDASSAWAKGTTVTKYAAVPPMFSCCVAGDGHGRETQRKELLSRA